MGRREQRSRGSSGTRDDVPMKTEYRRNQPGSERRVVGSLGVDSRRPAAKSHPEGLWALYAGYAVLLEQQWW
jgi:hypothetical protein